MAPTRSMRLLAWNCRGLGGPSTISQLTEAVNSYLLDITFISETKQHHKFIFTVCKRLKCRDNWDVVDPVGKRGGMLIFWKDSVQISQIIKTDFCIEVEVAGDVFEGKCWVVFIYASVEDSKRRLQWEYLKSRKNAWGTRWAVGGDFNDILRQEDKQGGIKRLENSFVPFRTFVRDMCMRELCFKGRRWTWANNRQGEGFIEERLDMFFTSAEWFLEFDQTEVQHILKQSSDHAMILLDTHPPSSKGEIKIYI